MLKLIGEQKDKKTSFDPIFFLQKVFLRQTQKPLQSFQRRPYLKYFVILMISDLITTLNYMLHET